MTGYRDSDTAAGPTIRRLRGKPLDVLPEHWWHRSSRCSVGDCVEVAAGDSVILVRDSKLDDSPVQVWELDEWRQLLRLIKNGWKADGVYELPDGCVELGLLHHDDLTFNADEWDAFTKGVLDEEFEPDVLSSKLSSPVSVGADDTEGVLDSGFASSVQGIEAATGAVSGWHSPGEPVPVAADRPLADAAPQGELVAERPHGGAASADGSGLRPSPATGAGEAGAASSGPVPVAAELSQACGPHCIDGYCCDTASDPPAGRDSLTTTSEVDAIATTGQPGSETGPSPVKPPFPFGFPEARRDHDPSATAASRDLPEAATPNNHGATTDGSLVWMDAAGTEVPPDPVPVAQPELIVHKIVHHVPVAQGECEACGAEVAYNLAAGIVSHTGATECESPTIGGFTPMDEKTLSELWAKAIAPLVRPDGAP